MRNKYGAQWTQLPSSRLTSTLRNDLKSYREVIGQATTSDSQLLASYKQVESDMEEMRAAAESGSVEALFQRAMTGAGPRSGSAAGQGNLLDDLDDADEQSVSAEIKAVEELLKKLELIKRERSQVLKDLKEKIREDDISNILILNKKATSSQDNQIFKSELDKFRPYQSRLLQATHKQHSLVKQLTQTYGELLNDKRVKAEQDRYEAYARQKGAVMQKYRKVHRTYKDLQTGLGRARGFYSQIKDTVGSLDENMATFLGNRKSEGSQLLKSIESARASSAQAQSREDSSRLADVMGRMNVSSPAPSSSGQYPFSPTENPGQYQPQYGHPQQVGAQSNMSPYGGSPYPLPGSGPVGSGPGIGAATPMYGGPVGGLYSQQPPAPSGYPSYPSYSQGQNQVQQQMGNGYIPHPGQMQGQTQQGPGQNQPHGQQQANAADPWAGLSGWQ